MDFVVVLLRAIHILLGVFWAGAIFLVAGFIGPAIKEAGPEGGKVMAILVKRKLLNVVPAAAILTILSGLWLYWHDSSGMQSEWMRSRMGMTLGTGALLSLVAFAIGLMVMRPSTMKAMALGQSLAQTPEGPAREATMAEIQRLRARAATGGVLVARLLGLAVLAMAVARYV